MRAHKASTALANSGEASRGNNVPPRQRSLRALPAETYCESCPQAEFSLGAEIGTAARAISPADVPDRYGKTSILYQE